MSLEPIAERWTAFGWEVIEINGDDMNQIVEVLDNADFSNNKPLLIVSRTTKGRGISCMENVLKWHHGVPTQDEYDQSMAELDACINNFANL